MSKDSLSGGPLAWLAANVGRILISVFVPVITFLVLWQGFIFLRDSNAPQLVIVLVAILWGVGGVAALYAVANWLVEQLPAQWSMRLQPFVFVGPALAILFWFLALPTLRTLDLSFRDATGQRYIGIGNYIFALTDRVMLEAFRNNLLWMVFGTLFCVGLGLLIAVLADRSRFESVYKAIIFMPMAISFVGAGVIWKFVYTYKGEGAGISEIGLLNAIVLALGGQSQPWLQLPPWNNFFLIIIMVWLQTGFAMVVISSAIKGISSEVLEAARVDGANEFQVFWHIIIPSIRGTLLTVTTTIIIFSLKLFDIVRVMTGGNNGTNVIANEFYLQRFTYSNAGRASAIAIILLLAVIPVMIYNLRQFRERRAF
ncbi:MAG: sugar ABC transporter permease [Anaerolineales bacterium]|nr:sugar ABC transporter permease [Anaerolineales bacterium]MCX7755034.1 sugar ABC transporter permease [Anaerolineales bacterium]MDW8279236.1 sugar ABC transporter permease [Anaerolineales bacterium]